jgi:hypothetical protein
MVPIHKRKLVVQKAAEGKLFEIPKSVLTKEGLGQAFKGLGTRALGSAFSPIGIASLGIGPYQQLKSYAKDRKTELLEQLDSINRYKNVDANIAAETGPTFPGSRLDLARQKEAEQSKINAGDYMQYDRSAQTGQSETPPTVTGQPMGADGQNIQGSIDAQKQVLKNADATTMKLEQQAAREGRLSQLKGVKDLVKDIMGDEGYAKAGNLMLLQLAASLVSGRTDKPGVGGFLDVLGQSGQKIIPMAIALEREREKDELELTKALISQMGKKESNKIQEPKYRGLIKDAVTGEDKIVFLSTTDDGKYIAYDNIKGTPIQYYIDPSNVKSLLNKEEDLKLKDKFLSQYKSQALGAKVTRAVLEIGSQNPNLIGYTGGWTLLLNRAMDQTKQIYGGKDYVESVQNMVADLRSDLPNAIDSTKPSLASDEAAKGLQYVNDNIFAKIQETLPLLQSDNETLRNQALLKTYGLIATYSLAQSLKDKDRLAVSDVKAAEQQLGNLITYVPLANRSSKEILSSYQVLNQQFNQGLDKTKKQAFALGVDITGVDNDYNQKFGFKNQSQVIVDSTSKNNQQDFNKIFSKDALGGALLK